MPGFDHELKVRLFQNRPELSPAMLSHTIGYPIPEFARAELGCTDHTKLKPQAFKSDNVVVLYNDAGAKVLAIINEIQEDVDKDKPYTWPLYIATVREQLRCPVRLMVLCPDENTERWAKEPIEFEYGGAVLRPAILGPTNTPFIDDIEQAKSLPEMSVLSAAAHGTDISVLKAAEAALAEVPEDMRLIYNDFIVSKLNTAARKMWEDLMATGTYEWQSDFARKYVGQGRHEGRAEGREEGLEEGREEGLAEGKREVLIQILETTSTTISPNARRHIQECTDTDRLQAWVTKALTTKLTNADELFD